MSFAPRCTPILVAVFIMLAVGACETVARSTDAVSRLLPKKEATADKPLPKTAARWRGTPADVVGMSEAELQSLFGAPSYVRHERPAAVWQYRRGGCIVDMFLYPDGRDAAYRVEHIELRPAQVGPPLSASAREVCFNDLRVG